jgi:glycosyltransferase involved in cell wall biosynthesis
MITYNHAAFIAQALDSVLMQRTNFEYEIVIGEDCSKDGTAEIIKKYQGNHPGKILPKFYEKNAGMNKNFQETLERCSGEYIAILEGDDYWTDPDKLQMQVDFLDKNLDCALCHHRVDHVVSPGGEKLREFPPQKFRAPRSDPGWLAMVNYIQTCSIVFRRKWLPVFGDQFQQLKLGDWPLCVLLGEQGWIGYLDRNMASYRIHANNTWNDRPADYKLRGMEMMALYLLERVGENSKPLWRDMLLAIALKDFLQALKSLSVPRSSAKLWRFITQSVEFKKPFWVLNRLWPYYKANYSGK